MGRCGRRRRLAVDCCRHGLPPHFQLAHLELVHSLRITTAGHADATGAGGIEAGLSARPASCCQLTSLPGRGFQSPDLLHRKDAARWLFACTHAVVPSTSLWRGFPDLPR